jgi:cytochrome b subunit of formate dehydrogenase
MLSVDKCIAVIAFLAMMLSSPSVWAQSNDECFVCHSETSLSMEKRGRTFSLYVDEKRFKNSAHADLECVSCHEGFTADEIPHAQRIKAVDCLGCHDGERFDNYTQSVHGVTEAGGRPAASCSDCHSTHSIQRVSDKQSEERKGFAEQVCAQCHDDIAALYMDSDHGLALVAGVKGAPSCIDCHGEHEMISPLSEGALTSRAREAAMCLSCHLDDPEVRPRVGPSAGFISSYENSVHSQAVKEGNEAAATCTDCHGAHEMRKGSNPSSKVAKTNIATTCGQCHGDIKTEFDESTHGKAIAAGISQSASCTDCHGEHDILSPTDPRSPVAPKNVSAQVCSPCHTSVKLTQKYGLASDRFQSFEDSYHGLASRAGSVEVANCASCHGVHDIKPSTDPTSRIHKSNLVNTCGTCHPGANENFAKGSVHVIAIGGQDEVLYFVATAYIILIVVVIGGMFVHNVFDFVRKSKRTLMYRRGLLPRHNVGHRLYLRMSLSERIQHGTLLVSFTILVITGFMLRFPDAWWVVWLESLSPAVFELRGVVHRVAGVVLVLAGLYHIYYVFFVPRGKQLLGDLLPARQDIADLVSVFKYNLGFSPDKPKFGRFSYIEKGEYWALIWGTVVMALTGVILWFDNTFLGLLTKLGWDVARTIHYYEAWLATLAVIVWHFYFVIFNPDTYPMNLAWWKGTLTEEEMEEEHPLELEEVKRQEMIADVMQAAESNEDRKTEEISKAAK